MEKRERKSFALESIGFYGFRFLMRCLKGLSVHPSICPLRNRTDRQKRVIKTENEQFDLRKEFWVTHYRMNQSSSHFFPSDRTAFKMEDCPSSTLSLSLITIFLILIFKAKFQRRSCVVKKFQKWTDIRQTISR